MHKHSLIRANKGNEITWKLLGNWMNLLGSGCWGIEAVWISATAFYVVSSKIKPGKWLKYSRCSCFISLFLQPNTFATLLAKFPHRKSTLLFMAKWWFLIKTIALLFVLHFVHRKTLNIGTLSLHRMWKLCCAFVWWSHSLYTSLQKRESFIFFMREFVRIM